MNLFASAYTKGDLRLMLGAVLYRNKSEADDEPNADRRLACVYIDVPEGHGIERGDGT